MRNSAQPCWTPPPDPPPHPPGLVVATSGGSHCHHQPGASWEQGGQRFKRFTHTHTHTHTFRRSGPCLWGNRGSRPGKKGISGEIASEPRAWGGVAQRPAGADGCLGPFGEASCHVERPCRCSLSGRSLSGQAERAAPCPGSAVHARVSLSRVVRAALSATVTCPCAPVVHAPFVRRVRGGLKGGREG